MRRVSLCMSIIILLLAVIVFPQGSVSAQTDYSNIRVKLSIGDSKTEQSVKLQGSYFIKQTGEQLTGGTLNASIDPDDGNITLEYTDTSDETRIVYTGSICDILRADPDISAGHFSLYNIYHSLTLKYLGDLTIRSYKSSSSYVLRLINTVPMRQYLYGVVPNEMPEYCPIEALKCQAIASKGFACYKISLSKSSSTYDILDTSQDQVYEGYKSNYPKSITAVDLTLNEAMYLSSGLFPTYYADSNGGETITPQMAWGNPTFYDDAYISCPDPYDIENPRSRVEMAFFPKENTSVSLTETQQPENSGVWYSSYSKINSFLLSYTKQALIAAGVTDQDAVVNSINNISSMYSTDSNGDESASMNHIYAHVTLNASVTADRLTLDSMQRSGGVYIASILSKPTYGISTYDAVSSVNIGMLSTDDITFSFSFKMSELYDINVMTRTGLRIYKVEPVDGGYAVFHRRFGHGVGLSQRGAEIMAGTKYNMTYDEILAFYFPGARLGRFSITEPTPPIIATPSSSPTSPTPSPKPSPTPTSTPAVSEYFIDRHNGIISGLMTDTTPEMFVSALSAQLNVSDISVSVNDKLTGFVGTNSIVSINGADFRVLLYGDTDGDGRITVSDVTKIISHIVGREELYGAYALAADVNRSLKINVSDATIVNQAIVGLVQIFQH